MVASYTKQSIEEVIEEVIEKEKEEAAAEISRKGKSRRSVLPTCHASPWDSSRQHEIVVSSRTEQLMTSGKNLRIGRVVC